MVKICLQGTMQYEKCLQGTNNDTKHMLYDICLEGTMIRNVPTGNYILSEICLQGTVAFIMPTRNYCMKYAYKELKYLIHIHVHGSTI